MWRIEGGNIPLPVLKCGGARRGRLFPQVVIVCHLERSEAPAERSRKTQLLFRSDEKQIAFPVRAAKAHICPASTFTKFNGDPRLRDPVVETHTCVSSDPNRKGVFRLRSADASLRSR